MHFKSEHAWVIIIGIEETQEISSNHVIVGLCPEYH